jgi:type IV pilus assembly protein PilC
MPEFLYKALDASGVTVEGVVDAASIGEASTVLGDRNLNVVSLTPRAIRTAYETPLTFALFGKKIKNRDVVVFSRQLSVLVSANIAIVQSLRTVQRQTVNPTLRAVVGEVASDVEAGTRLSTALAKHPKAFTPFYVNMVHSGETSGRIDEVLQYLADQLEKDYDLLSKVKGSMYYPAFIVFGMLVAGFVMMTFVVPRLVAVLTESGAQLPFATRALIAVSNFFVSFWWAILIVVVGGSIAFLRYIKTPDGAKVWGAIVIRIPVFGGIFQRLAVVRMVRSMRTLLDGGVDAVTALEISAEVVGNATYRDIILRTAAEVRDGRPIASVFAKEPKVVPLMVSQMLAVGEETGKLTDILERLAGFYSREIDNLIGGLVTLIEPVIIVIIGLAVGTMVAAILLPMYNLSQAF